MKALRSTLAAAAMLAVSAAGLLVSTPAAAEHRAVVAQDYGYRQHRDQRPPRITEVTPEEGDRVGDRRSTRVGARFFDNGSGIAAAWLALDGRDVTNHARFDGQEIRFRDDLAPGRHVAEVVVRDRAGNESRRAWSFVVTDRDRYDRRYEAFGQMQPYRW